VVETAAGIKWAYEIASASDRIAYMGGVSGGFWGDLGRSVGTILSDDGTESLYLRSKILVDVRAAGVSFPIGGGAIARTDPESIRAFALQNKHLGYTGFFSSTDPRTVAVVNQVFTPTAAEIEDWVKTVPLLEEAKAEGRIAFRMGERMYDVAGLDRVMDQLALARRLGLVD
jgi:citrate lyase subunit beta/citryl-CoA lyase